MVVRLRAVALVLGCLLIGVAIAPGRGVVAAQLLQVFIANDDAHPVPVHEQGTVDVSLSDPVLMRPAIPGTAFSVADFVAQGKLVISGPDGAATSYAITTIGASNPTDQDAVVVLSGDYGSTTDCLGFSGAPPLSSAAPRLSIKAHDTASMTFAQPFIVASEVGASSCLVASTPLVDGVHVTIVGYRL